MVQHEAPVNQLHRNSSWSRNLPGGTIPQTDPVTNLPGGQNVAGPVTAHRKNVTAIKNAINQECLDFFAAEQRRVAIYYQRRTTLDHRAMHQHFLFMAHYMRGLHVLHTTAPSSNAEEQV